MHAGWSWTNQGIYSSSSYTTLCLSLRCVTIIKTIIGIITFLIIGLSVCADYPYGNGESILEHLFLSGK